MRYMPLDQMKIASSSLVATVDAGTLASAGVNMRDYNWLVFVINTTDADADTTIDAKAQQDADAAFSNPTDITGLAIAQFTAAATAKQAVLAVHEGDITEDFVRVLVTAGNGTSGAEISIVVLGQLKSYAPGDHVATVEEVKYLDI